MIADFFIKIINDIINGISALGQYGMDLLPQSPVRNFEISINDAELLSNLNWILPINVIIQLLMYWIVAVSIIYVARIALKWLKVL